MSSDSGPACTISEGPSGVAAPKVLVVDANADGRDLIARTLRRKFPGMTVVEAESAERAAEVIRSHGLTAVVAHRVFEFSTGAELVQFLRPLAPSVPLIMTSSIDYRVDALAAGATAFLPADEWLMIGKVIEQFAGVPQMHSGGPFP